jgi:hypothetical protein
MTLVQPLEPLELELEELVLPELLELELDEAVPDELELELEPASLFVAGDDVSSPLHANTAPTTPLASTQRIPICNRVIGSSSQVLRTNPPGPPLKDPRIASKRTRPSL